MLRRITIRGSAVPPRVSQFNVALQREVIRGMTVEAAYVANRGASGFRARSIR